MRSFGGTSSDFIDLSSVLNSTPTAYSVHCAIRPATTAAGNYTAISLGGNTDWQIILRAEGANLAAYHQVQPSGFVNVSETGVLSAGVDALIGMSWDGSTVRLYRAGAEVASVAAATALTTFQTNNAIGYQRRDAADYMNGSVGEAAAWSVLLTAGEWAALGAGVSPALIRPQSRLFYYPLIREVIDPTGLTTATVTGTAVADHCRVYRPWNFGSVSVHPNTAPPTIGRFVTVPDFDSAYREQVEADSRHLAPALYLPVPPPPPPFAGPFAPALNPVVPPADGTWQEMIEAHLATISQATPAPLTNLPPTPLPQAGRTGKGLIPRDPLADVPTRRALDRISDILNSLMSEGRLGLFDRDGRWTVGGGIIATRPPAAGDDITVGALPGMNWVNTASQKVWVCASNTAGAAVWVAVN